MLIESKKQANILIITNMGTTKEKPYSGIFVRNQFKALNSLKSITADYYEMPDLKVSASLLKLLRYPLFAIVFLKRYIFSTKRFDIIHVHFFYPTIYLAIIYKLFRNPKCKIIATFHGNDIYAYLPFSRLYRLTTKFIDSAIFVSGKLQSKIQLSVAQHVISAGISDIFTVDSSVNKKTYDLLFVGNLDFNKGSDRLINLLANFSAPLNVAIVGVGPYADTFKQLATQHNITFMGALQAPEIKTLCQLSKYLINLSRKESFGLAMTEAMACGTPIICTNTDGSAAQIIHTKNGFCVAQEDEKFDLNLVKLVSHALELSEHEYKAICEQAVKDAQPYTVSQIAAQLATIYRELI